jgi:hypothetical protein
MVQRIGTVMNGALVRMSATEPSAFVNQQTDKKNADVIGSMRTIIPLSALSYLLGFLDYWQFIYNDFPHMNDLYDYQRSLLAGHAPWLADQNRVLAPILISLLRRVLATNYSAAYQHYMLWSFIGLNWSILILILVSRVDTDRAVVGVLAAAAMPVCLMNYWWYPWTNLEAVLLCLMFIVDALQLTLRWRWFWFSVIFCFFIFTKETCIFLPIWIFIRAVFEARSTGTRGKSLVATGIVCAIMIVCGVGIDAALRHLLWISGTIPGIPSGVPPVPTVLGTHILMLDYPQETFGYYRQILNGLFSARTPASFFGDKIWPDWPAGGIAFVGLFGVTVAGMIWSWRGRESVLSAIFCFVILYMIVCFGLVNMPEGDKLLPVVVAYVYAYSRIMRPEKKKIT